jgi:hypothetical protein
MATSVGGGERGSSSISECGNERRATSGGRFLRRRSREGVAFESVPFILEMAGMASLGSWSSLVGISSGGVVASKRTEGLAEGCFVRPAMVVCEPLST